MELKDIEKRIKYIWSFLKRKRISLPILVAAYFVLRFTFGLSKNVIYGYILFLLGLGVTVETVSLVFFIIALIVYIFGGWVEANNYFSYIYIGLILVVVKYFYLEIRERKKHQ